MARRPDPAARDRILEVASRLFDEHGVRAVGLQQIIDARGCGKNLLYREFGSKDELVLAYLERFGCDWDAILAEAAEAAPDDPAAQLVAIVDGVAERASAEGFKGCTLTNVHAEFPEEGHPVNRAIVAHYTRRLTSLRELARRTNAPDPDALADRLSLIIDGLNANAGVLGAGGSLNAATTFARDAVANATRG
ncbi:TetR/AcrR family transcriptional regulator [Streptomyces sp. 6N223]|uniref:TetR/AcrR family transcriptional regulator n=1 Tax=Streptomyces sp. 6N223 TaxID=3457412 RepID=UPI003FD4AA4B